MATAKMELHLSLRDKLSMGLNTVKDKVNKSVGNLKLDNWFLKNDKKQFKGALILDANGKELYKKSDVL